jgi:putative tricarboxylic transport membrane protein
MIADLFAGFVATFIHPMSILLIFAGVGIGVVIGAMPGLTATMGIAIALPLTFGMRPEFGLTLLASIFIGGIHGGGIPGILIRTPGTPASAASMIDGFELSRQGKASLALGVHVFASATGSFLATLILIFGSAILANFALDFGPAEFFLLAVFGLTVVSSVTGRSTIRGLLMAGLGLLLSTVGVDPIRGYPRFSFGVFELLDGISLVPALIGLFAISQVLVEVITLDQPIVQAERLARSCLRSSSRVSSARSLVPYPAPGQCSGRSSRMRKQSAPARNPRHLEPVPWKELLPRRLETTLLQLAHLSRP